MVVLGTSLSGLNSDRVATEAAARSLEGGALGTVIINLQQTARDGAASLRMFAPIDEVLRWCSQYSCQRTFTDLKNFASLLNTKLHIA